MSVLIFGLILIALAFFLHLVVWKIYLPKRQTKTLLQIFFGVLVISLFVLWQKSALITNIGLPLPESYLEYFQIALFFVSFTLAYLCTYSALEVDSPSLIMIIKIAEAGGSGLTKEEFDQTMTDDILVKTRINDLLIDKMAYLNKDRYRLTVKGRVMTRLFIFYRKLMNLNRKGG